ncbi:MAG: molybdenum cofactor guanylyltransferase [Vicinamibacterales bacterium]
MPSAAILNGGRAVRFGGSDKGALRVGGRTVRAWQLEQLAAVSDDLMLVGGTPPPVDAYEPPYRVVADSHPGLGPLAGLEAALAAARHELVVVVACDMPGITASLLTRLLALADEVDLVVPRSERGYHPLCAVYRRSTCLPVARQHLIERRLAVRGLFPALRLRELAGPALAAAGDPDQLLANINTPAEHRAIAARADDQGDDRAHTAHIHEP